MALLIDSDLLVDRERGVRAETTERLLGDEERAISVITVSELLHGVHRAAGERRARRSAFVEHLLAGMQAIPITEPVARVHAELWAQLTERGRPIGAHDLWTRARTRRARCASSPPRPSARRRRTPRCRRAPPSACTRARRRAAPRR